MIKLETKYWKQRDTRRQVSSLFEKSQVDFFPTFVSFNHRDYLQVSRLTRPKLSPLLMSYDWPVYFFFFFIRFHHEGAGHTIQQRSKLGVPLREARWA